MINCSIERDLKSLYRKRGQIQAKTVADIAAVDNKISSLQAKRNQVRGYHKVNLRDDELVFLVKSILENPRPVTKVIASCAKYFNNPPYWVSRVKRYKPLSPQMERVFSLVEVSDCPQIHLLKKYELLNLRKLIACSEIGVALNTLKRCYREALKLDEKDQKIAELECLVESLRAELVEKDDLIKRKKTASAREMAIMLRNQYPKMTVTDISIRIDMSRTTTHKYLNGK